MDKAKKSISLKRKIEVSIILLYCAIVTTGVLFVLLFEYRPNINALGALGTVCLDVFSIFVMIVLVISLIFEREEINRTTKLFLCLMLGTIWGLFFDFLTWSADGSLAFSNRNYFYVVASLCTGSVLAFIFVIYLSSYLCDMYKLRSSVIRAKVYAGLNMFSFALTLILAITKTAFTFENGHYQLGALYDVVTVIPMLSLVLMTAYIVRNKKVIGSHDTLAVVGYIVTMLTGAIVESIFVIGATYVGVTIANIFIFLMLQNRLVNNIKEQRELLAEKISSQYDILESMAGIYSYVNYVDLEEMSERRFDLKESISAEPSRIEGSHTELNKKLIEGIDEEMKEKYMDFTNLLSLPSRMKGEKVISSEFHHKKEGWFRAQYIRIGEDTNAKAEKVIYAIRNIDEEKKNVEMWIEKSNTDEMTGFFNRHAYEEDIASFDSDKNKENFVYVSIDVNSLKLVNDMRGHDAGDELIVGACECMRQCFGSYGKLYRTGGDEFAALIYADDSELEDIKKDLEEITENWHGKLNDNLTISCGYVRKKEASDMTLHQIAVLADKRMYEDKTRYYQRKGIDRRGQRDAHVALCALYTKILKVNITNDTYQMVNVATDEKNPDKGFADTISAWLRDFAITGQVHPDDVEEYLKKTDLRYISNYFAENTKPLRVFYRRKADNGYRQVMMEMIPANNYKEDSQNLFLYVKDIDNV